MRFMIFDRTWAGGPIQPGLTSSWVAGAVLYRALGRLDVTRGVTSWSEGLRFVAEHQPHAPIDEIQFWGHGHAGRAYIGKDVLDVSALEHGHALFDVMVQVRRRMHPKSLWWFRTCETFGRARGQAFASAWSRFFGSRVAGHTYVIGPWQSGLHVLAPGAQPHWSVSEALVDGDDPARPARMSSRRAPHTISCLHGAIPSSFERA